MWKRKCRGVRDRGDKRDWREVFQRENGQDHLAPRRKDLEQMKEEDETEKMQEVRAIENDDIFFLIRRIKCVQCLLIASTPFTSTLILK